MNLSRSFLLAGIVASCLTVGSSAPAGADVPRGTPDFTLGASYDQIDSVLARREVEILSRGLAFITCHGSDPDIAYESYDFFVGPHGTTQLWRVTFAYQTPYEASSFQAMEDHLRNVLGEPSQAETAPERKFNDNPGRTLIWIDLRTDVRLAGHVQGGGEDPADRMLVTWTDRKIWKLVEAKRRQERKKD